MSGAPGSITVVHSVMLLAEPTLGARALAFVSSGEHLKTSGSEAGFARVEHDDGLRGFVPLVVCAPLAANADKADSTLQVAQPVTLYRQPVPGSQFTLPDVLNSAQPHPSLQSEEVISSPPHPPALEQSTWLVWPDEALLLLGADDRFALVQRDNGQIGYVPVAVCNRSSRAGQIFTIGGFDVGWMFLGGGWMSLNLGGLVAVVQLLGLGALPIKSVIELGIVLGIIGTLWLRSPRRFLARPFALGALLCYLVVYLLGGGGLTL